MILRADGRTNEEGKEEKWLLIVFEDKEVVPEHLLDKVVNKSLMIQVPYEGDNKFKEETNLLENINIAVRIIFDIKPEDGAPVLKEELPTDKQSKKK